MGDIMRKFCENCLKEVNCEYFEDNKEIVVNNKTIKYLEKYYICSECNNKFYDDLHDYNVSTVNNELRKLNNLVTIDEIKEIMKKYNIGKKPLSVVLGLGEVTITRYLEGRNPTKDNSDLLKCINTNPFLYEMFLIANKDKITNIAFKKSLGKTKQLELVKNKSKLYDTTLYIIKKIGEITPLALQKVLYFAQCFSNKFLNEYLFDDTAEAWVYGPVYKDIYDSLSYYKYELINYDELLKDYDFNLNKNEKDYLDYIIKYFGCYSACILREMSHLTNPWISAREGLGKEEYSSRTIELNSIDTYIKDICNKFKISNIEDINKYSERLFKEAQTMI